MPSKNGNQNRVGAGSAKYIQDIGYMYVYVEKKLRLFF